MLKTGDEVRIQDRSWAFGIKNGKYTTAAPVHEVLTVVRTNLKTVRNVSDLASKYCDATVDLLVTDKDGGFWFVKSGFVTPLTFRHIITIDGVNIEISHETFNNIKEQFLQ